MSRIVPTCCVILVFPCFVAAHHDTSQEETPVWYEIVNVTIPADSPHRHNKSLNKPPRIFVIVKEDGKPIGPSRGWLSQLGPSTNHYPGWEVDFEKGIKDHRWPIWSRGDKVYSIEFWDFNHVWNNVQVLSITQLKGADFAKLTIYENTSPNLTAERKATIKFRQIPAPEE